MNTGRCSLLSLQQSSEQYCRAGCLERPTRQAPGLLAGLAVPAVSMCPCVRAMPTCPRNLTRAPRHRAPDTWNRLGLAFRPSDVKCPPAVRPANQPRLSKASSGPRPRGAHLLGLSPEVSFLAFRIELAGWIRLLHCRLYVRRRRRLLRSTRAFDTCCKVVALHRPRREDDSLDGHASGFVYIARGCHSFPRWAWSTPPRLPKRRWRNNPLTGPPSPPSRY